MKYIFGILFLIVSVFADDDYELGRGYKLSGIPAYIGGYVSVDFRRKDEQNRYRVDDVAFLAYGGEEKFSYLAELEFKDLYIKTDEASSSQTNYNKKLHVERLYFNYKLSQDKEIRVGKYNSPIGFWNEMPINVLRETTSNPYLSDIIYPEFTTGVDLKYNHYANSVFETHLLLQHNAPIDHEYNNYNVNRHYGIAILNERDNFTYKLNLGYFQVRDQQHHDHYEYGVIAAKYDLNEYEFMAESGVQKLSTNKYSYASYLQALRRFHEKHIAILRLESYKNAEQNVHNNIIIGGYTYRPLYPIALKAEFQKHTLRHESQFLCSFSVIF